MLVCDEDILYPIKFELVKAYVFKSGRRKSDIGDLCSFNTHFQIITMVNLPSPYLGKGIYSSIKKTNCFF